MEEPETKWGWWRDAKFGMFVHWGLYAVTGGIWNGQEVNGVSEWIMNYKKIPVREYAKLAKVFDPAAFSAKRWVEIAVSAGMKYMVVTAKHHDGFAMFHSKVSPYNIVDATPFKRDPMKELATACARKGMKLCLYYSQTQDWHDPNGEGNRWDYPDQDTKNFDQYLVEKVMPQLRELLSNYGPIGMIWFDTPRMLTDAQSRQLKMFVQELQPDCMVNSRIGNGHGNYLCLGDNELPVHVMSEPWETCATLNDTWGYKKNDQHWKSAETIIKQLSDITGKGGNFLLNVGPTADGDFPMPSVEILKETGRWFAIHGEAIRETKPNPFNCEFPWGTITVKPGRMYVHLHEWSGFAFSMYGLKNEVVKAYLLSEPQTMLEYSQLTNASEGFDELRVTLPELDQHLVVSILVLEFSGPLQVDHRIRQQPDGHIYLEAHQARINRHHAHSEMALAGNGIISNWLLTGDELEWQFEVHEPGTFHVELYSSSERARLQMEAVGRWDGGHELVVESGHETLAFHAGLDQRIISPRCLYHHRILSKGGTLHLSAPGIHVLRLRSRHIKAQNNLGLKLISLVLRKGGNAIHERKSGCRDTGIK